MPEFIHIPVLANEVIDGLNIKSKGVYVDCTCGGGGHSALILQKLNGGMLICFDQDIDAITACKQRLGDSATYINENFKNIKGELAKRGITKVDGILADLGVSSYQIDTAERGFSFLHDGPLDMRMDKRNSLSAYDVVNTFPEDKIKDILYRFGEESFAPKIAHEIVVRRKQKPIETTFELKNLIESVIPKKIIFSKGGASKKTFQALRIYVNSELDDLEGAINDFIDLLSPKGRLAIISFHSLEDRIVKNVMKLHSTDCICPPKTPICICHHKSDGKLVNKKPILPSEQELASNPRSHSAKLRIFEKF